VWWRVVLDEAQNIKDQKAQRSLAVFDLKVSLWFCCLSGGLLSITTNQSIISSAFLVSGTH